MKNKIFFRNPKTSKIIDATSSRGKKIIDELKGDAENIEYFKDKKGENPIVEQQKEHVSSTIPTRNVVMTTRLIPLQPNEEYVRPPDEPMMERLLHSNVPTIPDLLSDVLRMSMDTYRDEKMRRMREFRQERQRELMRIADEEAQEREEDLDGNINRYRVIRVTMTPKKKEKDLEKQKLKKENEKLKKELKEKKELQKKRLKKKN